MTNYERIKSMSIDEMAEYLIDCCNCPNDMFLCGSKGSVGEKHIMHWHLPDETSSFDGCSNHSYCKFCNKEIMQDSQGNWFTFN